VTTGIAGESRYTPTSPTAPHPSDLAQWKYHLLSISFATQFSLSMSSYVRLLALAMAVAMQSRSSRKPQGGVWNAHLRVSNAIPVQINNLSLEYDKSDGQNVRAGSIVPTNFVENVGSYTMSRCTAYLGLSLPISRTSTLATTSTLTAIENA
jgi:hypothetical protein